MNDQTKEVLINEFSDFFDEMPENNFNYFQKFFDLDAPIMAEKQEPPCEVCEKIEIMSWKEAPHFYKTGIYHDPYYKTFFAWHGWSGCSDTYSRISNATFEDIKYCPRCGKPLKL